MGNSLPWLAQAKPIKEGAPSLAGLPVSPALHFKEMDTYDNRANIQLLHLKYYDTLKMVGK